MDQVVRIGNDLTGYTVCSTFKGLDWGAMISGHGSVLDQMDSVSFAAPILFHLTRYFFSV